MVLTPGTAWFADAQAGVVSLLDGLTASRVSVQPVGRPGDDISVMQSGVQSGSGAYAVDHTTGDITFVDGSTLKPGHPVQSSAPDDQSLTVISNPNATWAVTQNGTLAERVDPFTLAPLAPPVVLASSRTPPVETPDGSLWTVGASGGVVSFSPGGARLETRPVTSSFALVESQSRPVVADRNAGEVLILDPRTGRVSRRVTFNPPGSTPLITGTGDAPYVLSVDSTNGVLQAVNVVTGRAATLAIGDASSAARYGPAVLKGDLIFVPDFAQAAVVVAEVQQDHLTLLGEVPVGQGRFNLLNYHSNVWFDDPATGLAGVITANLEAIRIAKTGDDGQGKVVGHLGPVHLRTGTVQPTPPVAHPPSTLPLGGAPPPPPVPRPSGHRPASPTIPVPSSTVPTTSTTVRASPTKTAAAPSPSTTVPATTPTTVSPAPVPNFTWSQPARAGLPVKFTDTSTGAHQIFQWTFGPSGTILTTASPTFTWNTAGTFTVTLVITSHGSSFAVQKQVVVTPVPVTCVTGSRTIGPGNAVAWSVPPGCAHLTIDLKGAVGGANVSDAAGGEVGLPAEVKGTVTVAPGEQFSFRAGGQGATGSAGSNGGGQPGCSAAGGGGGMSEVVEAGGTPARVVAVAAGGGGDGADGSTSSGSGTTTVLVGSAGGNTGESGAGGGNDGGGGGGGTAAAPGAGGAGFKPIEPGGNGLAGSAGSGHNGGNGGPLPTTSNSACGGGGGAGSFGGGGGGSSAFVFFFGGYGGGGGGGGGSNLVPAGWTASLGNAWGDGSVTWLWTS